MRKHNTSTDARDYIHAAWVCVSSNGGRVEDADKQLVEDLTSLGIQVIVVLTKCSNLQSEQTRQFFDFVKNEFKGLAHSVVQTRGIEEKILDDETGEIIKEKPPYGIDHLIKETFALIPAAQKQAFASALNAQHKEAILLKTEQARTAINWAKTAAGAAAVVPIPFSEAVALVPIQAGMIIKISSIFNVPFEDKDILPAIATLATSLGTTVATQTAAAGLLKFIPVIGSVAGGALGAAAALKITQLLGESYLEALVRLSEQKKPLTFQSALAIVEDSL